MRFTLDEEQVRESFELQDKLVRIFKENKKIVYAAMGILLLYGYVGWLYYYFTRHIIEVFIYASQLIWIVIALNLILGVLIGFAVGKRYK